MRHALEWKAIGIAQILRREGHGRCGVRDELERIADGKLVALRQHGAPVGRGALHDGADLRTGKVGGVFRVLPRLAEVEPGTVRPVADLQHLALPDRVERPPGDGIVERVAVGIRDRADIIGALGAPLDLQARNAGRQQLRQVIDHAHVAGVEDVRPARVLRDVKHLAGALGLREAVLPAAGLGAAAAVGIAPGEIV